MEKLLKSDTNVQVEIRDGRIQGAVECIPRGQLGLGLGHRRRGKRSVGEGSSF